MKAIRHGRETSGHHTYRAENGDLISIDWITSGVRNPCRVPSKADGRKGTRRAWKRAHPPGYLNRLFGWLS